MSTTYVVRDAGPGDEPEVARLMALIGTTIPPGDSRAAEGVEDFRRDGGVVLVAEAEGRIVGACSLLVKRFNPMDATPGAWLDGLAVDEPYRRLGIGRALMQEARRRAEAAGCDSIVLHSHEHQEEAMRLYEDLGLVRHGLLLVWPLDRPG